jgi:hypothetical protein
VTSFQVAGREEGKKHVKNVARITNRPPTRVIGGSASLVIVREREM